MPWICGKCSSDAVEREQVGKHVEVDKFWLVDLLIGDKPKQHQGLEAQCLTSTK